MAGHDWNEWRRRLAERRTVVGVIGLGYVGLPLALLFAERGFRCLGFDIDPEKIARLADGQSYIGHIAASRVAAARQGGAFLPTADFARLSEPDAIAICVPTPLAPGRAPDLSFIAGTVRQIAAHLRPGQLVSLESTTYPGTTSEVVRPLLEASGLSHGSDFLLAYSPEREDPGNAEHGVGRTPKVVGGENDLARELACALYGAVVPRTIPVSSTGTAEAVKLTENVFRAVNIALVNELKVIYGRMGIDIWEVIEAAKSKPFGFMAFYPGPGLGGHCIPIDPFYLAWRARQFDAPARFVELAGEINAAMPALVVERLLAALRTRSGIGLDGARILLLGVAYKPNVGDVRESPAFALWELLEAQGASVCYHDPHVAVLPPTREHRKLAGIESQALTADLLAAVDGVLICTDHAAVDYALVVEHARLIVDTRNATAAVRAGRANVVLA